MKKEQFRKELEDCWDAAVEYYDYVKSKPIGYRDGKFPDRKEYLTTRLAALDDGTAVIEPINMDDDKEVVIKKIMKECARMLLTTYVMFELKEFMEVMVVNEADNTEYVLSFRRFDSHLKRFPLESKPLDDGQEGRGLPKFLVIKDYDGTLEIWDKNRYETYVRKATDYGATPAIQIIVGFNGDENFISALPVADGEGEKVDENPVELILSIENICDRTKFSSNPQDYIDALYEIKALLPSAVTGGVKDAVGFINWAMDNNYQCKLKNITGGYEWYIDDEDGVPVDYLSPEQLYQVYLSEGQPANGDEV